MLGPARIDLRHYLNHSERGESKRELESHIADRDRKRMAIHNLESEVHQLELNLNSKRQQKKERDTFEAQREDFKLEIAGLEQKTKVH
jgi:hypothetical protein